MKKRNDDNKIFVFTGRIPIVQILILLILGSICLWVATNVQVGNYVSFEATVSWDGQNYIVKIPEDKMLLLTNESKGKWSFDSVIGKRFPLNVLSQSNRHDPIYVLDTSELGLNELNRLDKGSMVYVDFQTSNHSLISFGESK